MRVSNQELFRLCLKTFVVPFLPARLAAPGSPRIYTLKSLYSNSPCGHLAITDILMMRAGAKSPRKKKKELPTFEINSRPLRTLASENTNSLTNSLKAVDLFFVFSKSRFVKLIHNIYGCILRGKKRTGYLLEKITIHYHLGKTKLFWI